ncbi:phospho-sugar mutase [Nesterenkonia alkaliphila]|uniref:phospho-sugar mutase n=1 Tax=Nesterenkonia alkaliphila TaxID=1463631 RepID=UPI001992EF73|nr:phospho-sugar mutase [Nesterenkonia alkaliphila]GFZ92767.1 phosphomannomutase [Nesterenkonia alkaliphila]
MAELLSTAKRWIALDPDPSTRTELTELLDDAESGDQVAYDTLERLFAGRLAFGTAGLRAELGPGPLRMNRLVVRQTAAGLLKYADAVLAAAHGRVDNPHDVEGTKAHRIVIGYDARYQSDEFAFETAEIFRDAGWEVHLFDRPGPTPLLARQVLVADAEVGVMVTASHNPPQDNGYKVYLGGELSRYLEPDGLGVGAQIVSPVDREIAATIAEVVAADFAVDSATPEAQLSPDVPAPAGVHWIGQQARDSYQREALQLLDPESYPHRDITIVYTAMHGVGGQAVTDLLYAAGFADVIPVQEQFEPDPAFPTADFPNPEEAGALDLALKAAAEHSADLVLANDPDADRLSAAVYDAAAESWRQLSGDEIGALLGRHILERGPLRTGWQTPASQASTGPAESTPTIGNSVVSSRLLGKLALGRGAAHEETLTGFKWLARVPNLVFGYEEAIGFDVDPVHVRDKDGVSAALIFSELIADLKAKGQTALSALDEIAAEAGVHITGQVTIRVEDLSQLGEVTAALRRNPPAEIAGDPVVESLDLREHPLPGKEFTEAKSTDALIYLTAGGHRVIVRPSGTEPKVKCYLEAVASPDSSAPQAVTAARQNAEAQLQQLRSSMEQILS